jgi:1-acyl-sn-glycerol-3-phosphate acyltransferase
VTRRVLREPVLARAPAARILVPVVTSSVTPPVHRPWRVRLTRGFCRLAVHGLFRVRVEDADRFATGPAIYCFNHLNWLDPFLLIALLPTRPRFALFGPKEEDMAAGGRNRLIAWTGLAIPYRPAKDDLIDTTRKVTRALADGWVIAIAGEGRIHRGERELMPLAEGTAYFALRASVPVIPVAINGTSWLGFRRRIRVRVGEPIAAAGRPTREAVAAMTGRTEDALRALVADFPDPPEPGRFGRWLTELFNDWPEGARPRLGEGDAATLERGRAAGQGGAA